MIKLTDLVFRPRPFTITNAFLIILIIYLSGCAANKPYQIELMPAPDVYEKGLIDPFNGRNTLKAIPYEDILYATDRQPSHAEHHFINFESVMSYWPAVILTASFLALMWLTAC